MERRRNATPVEKAVENMDRASSKGWRSVFANGRWEDGGAEVKGVEKEETIPFVSECHSQGKAESVSSCQADDPGISHLIVSVVRPLS